MYVWYGCNDDDDNGESGGVNNITILNNFIY